MLSKFAETDKQQYAQAGATPAAGAATPAATGDAATDAYAQYAAYWYISFFFSSPTNCPSSLRGIYPSDAFFFTGLNSAMMSMIQLVSLSACRTSGD